MDGYWPLSNEWKYQEKYSKADKIVIKELIMKIKKGIPLIDQHDKNYLYGGKFGGILFRDTKKPIDDLTILFKLRKDKKF